MRKNFIKTVGVTNVKHESHIVFVVGEEEYSSEVSIPRLAADWQNNYGINATVLTAQPDPFNPSNIPGLEALRNADLAVFYIRFRTLPDVQLKPIEDYLRRGKPVVGFRTSTHGFRYPDDHPSALWNDFGPKVLGAPWIHHYGGKGHTSSTDVRWADGVEQHPVLQGVDKEFHVRSWLYQVYPDYPPQEAQVLLMGKSVGPGRGAEENRQDNPVAWTMQHSGGGRVFMTTMGHPEDFAVPAFQRLIYNGACWSLGQVDRIPDWKGVGP
jgi:type 1 glutamine amidotransferase